MLKYSVIVAFFRIFLFTHIFPTLIISNAGLGTKNEVVSKRWHNLFYILQFCYIFFWLCCFFLMHLATSCYIPIISGYK